MRILITGGAGFVGSHLARRLLATGHEVALYDSFSTALHSNTRDLQTRAPIVVGDTLDLSHLLRVAKEHRIQRIVHTAAVVGVPLASERPLFAAKVNIEGTLNVLETARLLGIERVLDMSSGEAYGPVQREPTPEDHPLNTVTPYGITKLAAERFGNHYADHYGIQYVAARLGWVYGPGYPRPRLPRPWMEDALAGRRTVMSQGGDLRIDFTYIDDVVEGLRLLVEAPNLQHRAYNVASGHAVSLQEVAIEVKRLISSWDYEIGEGSLEQSPGYVAPQKGSLDIGRISRELRYRPTYDLGTGFSLYLASLREELAEARS